MPADVPADAVPIPIRTLTALIRLAVPAGMRDNSLGLDAAHLAHGLRALYPHLPADAQAMVMAVIAEGLEAACGQRRAHRAWIDLAQWIMSPDSRSLDPCASHAPGDGVGGSVWAPGHDTFGSKSHKATEATCDSAVAEASLCELAHHVWKE